MYILIYFTLYIQITTTRMHMVNEIITSQGLFYSRALVYEIFRALYLEYLNSQQFVCFKNYAKVDIIVLRRKVPIEGLKKKEGFIL